MQTMSKDSRNGGKFSGNHTSLIPAAVLVCDYIAKCKSVTKISPGIIKAGLSSLRGKRRIKASRKFPAFFLSVRDNASQQEIYLYSNNVEETLETLKNFCLKNNFNLSFEDKKLI